MVGEAAIVPTRSHDQAFDWSLALLSEGIESTVDRDSESGRWILVVDAGQITPAIHVLRQYVAENRRVPRTQPPAPKLIFDWGSTWFFVLLIFLFGLTQTSAPALKDFGVMDRTGFLAGEWWRPFTAVLLHFDLAHLAANVSIGMVFLGLAGGMFGAGRALLISYAAGVAANLAHCLIPSSFSGLGASGMVMGALGLITSNAVSHPHAEGKTVGLRGAGAGLLLLVLLGFDPHPRTDVFAHVIGFVVGFAFGLGSLLFRSRAGSALVKSPPSRICHG